MKIWKHILIIFIFGSILIILSVVNMMLCAFTFGPHESNINCQMMQVFGYFPFPLQLLKHYVSVKIDFLLFLINHIFIASVVYLTILFGYRYLKKLVPSHRSNTIDGK